jgi:hypothetical protein
VKYYHDMRRPFGDGEAVPEGVAEYRGVYIRAINALAAKRGSKVVAVGYDRPGMHNWCLIDFETDEKPTDLDEIMCDAIAELMEMDMDRFVKVKVEVDEDALAKFLEAVERGEVEA